MFRHCPFFFSDGMVQMSWSCGHNGFIGVDWLKQHRYIVPVDGEDTTKPLVAVSNECC